VQKEVSAMLTVAAIQLYVIKGFKDVNARRVNVKPKNALAS